MPRPDTSCLSPYQSLPAPHLSRAGSFDRFLNLQIGLVIAMQVRCPALAGCTGFPCGLLAGADVLAACMWGSCSRPCSYHAPSLACLPCHPPTAVPHTPPPLACPPAALLQLAMCLFCAIGNYIWIQKAGKSHYYLALDTYVQGNWSSPAAQVGGLRAVPWHLCWVGSCWVACGWSWITQQASRRRGGRAQWLGVGAIAAACKGPGGAGLGQHAAKGPCQVA